MTQPRSPEELRALIELWRTQLDAEKAQRPREETPRVSELPPWYITVPLTILLIPVYAGYLAVWLAGCIFNFGMAKPNWRIGG